MTTDDLLKQGIAALNAGQKAEARSLLTQVVEQDERNEMGWLWLSGAVETDEERCLCLENVLAINPTNGIAQRGLEKFRKSAYGLDSTSDAASREAATVRPIGEARTGVEFQPATDETHEILRQAVAAIKSGDKERGKQLLVEVIEQDDDNETAWLWMTRCVTDRDVKRECFERVLAINPDNKHAIEGLKRLEVLSKVEASSPKRKKMTKQQTRLEPAGKSVKILFVLIGLALVAWLFVGLRSCFSEPSRSPATATPDEGDNFDAYFVCKDFIKDHLVAPSTADFPSYLDVTVVRLRDQDGEAYRVAGYVDAQNRFGAVIRINYVCEIAYLGGGDWKLEKLDIEE